MPTATRDDDDDAVEIAENGLQTSRGGTSSAANAQIGSEESLPSVSHPGSEGLAVRTTIVSSGAEGQEAPTEKESQGDQTQMKNLSAAAYGENAAT